VQGDGRVTAFHRSVNVLANAVKRARPPARDQPQAVARKLPILPPGAVAEPKLTPKAIRALEFAVKSMERKDWSLNRRLLTAHHHLQSDSMIANITPDELITKDSHD
jgi:hypothetical protein